MRTRRAELLAVGALFVVTGAYLAIQAARVDSYIWLVDELLYTKAALGAGHELGGHVFGQSYLLPNGLYSWLIAAPYKTVSNIHAFRAAHVIDALVYASTLVPVYLTARLMGARRAYALVGAALAVWVPWAVATTVLMTESLGYATFAWAVLAMTAAVAYPSPRNDLLALVALGAASYARTQFVLLVPVFVVTLLLHELTWPAADRRERIARLRGHWVLGAVIVLGGLLALVAGLGLLGAYGGTAHAERLPNGLIDSMAAHLGRIIVGCGVVPVLLWAAWSIRSAINPLNRAAHAFAYLSSLAVFLLIYEAGFFAQQVAGGAVQERYAFYVVALFAAGAGAMLSDERRPGPIGSLLAAAVAAIPIIGTVSWPAAEPAFDTVASGASGFGKEITDAMHSLAPSWTTRGALAVVIVVLAALTAAALNAGASRRFTVPALAALTLLFCVVETHTVLDRVIPGINTTYITSLGNPPKSWVDGLVYKGDEQVGALEGFLEGDQAGAWEWTEFWNSRVNRLYQIAGAQPPASQLPATQISFDAPTGRLTAALQRPLLVVSSVDPALGIQGQVVRTIQGGQSLIRPAQPWRAAWAYGKASGATDLTVTPTPFSVYPAGPAQRTATIGLDLVAADAVTGPAFWTARAPGVPAQHGRIAKGARMHLTVRVQVPAGAQSAQVLLSANSRGVPNPVHLRNPSITWGP